MGTGRLGCVQPGAICSGRLRARALFSRMRSTLAVHTKGLERAYDAALHENNQRKHASWIAALKTESGAA